MQIQGRTNWKKVFGCMKKICKTPFRDSHHHKIKKAHQASPAGPVKTHTSNINVSTSSLMSRSLSGLPSMVEFSNMSMNAFFCLIPVSSILSIELLLTNPLSFNRRSLITFSENWWSTFKILRCNRDCGDNLHTFSNRRKTLKNRDTIELATLQRIVFKIILPDIGLLVKMVETMIWHAHSYLAIHVDVYTVLLQVGECIG